MEIPDSDKSFAGAMPQVYGTLLVPLIFEPYAVDMARRLAARPVVISFNASMQYH